MTSCVHPRSDKDLEALVSVFRFRQTSAVSELTLVSRFWPKTTGPAVSGNTVMPVDEIKTQ